MAVLWPLSRRRIVAEGSPDKQFYREQDRRDRAGPGARPSDGRGGRGRADRGGAASPARRFRPKPSARACRRAGPAPPSGCLGGRALDDSRSWRLRLTALSARPHLPGQPLAARLEADPQRSTWRPRSRAIEAHLAKNPQDGRGWEVVAPVYVRTGRTNDAVKAYESALRLLGAGCEPPDQLRRGAGGGEGRRRARPRPGGLRASRSHSIPGAEGALLSGPGGRAGWRPRGGARALRALLSSSPPNAPGLRSFGSSSRASAARALRPRGASGAGAARRSTAWSRAWPPARRPRRHAGRVGAADPLLVVLGRRGEGRDGAG